MKKNVIALSLIASTFAASGQWINRFSLQVEGGNHYDLFTPGKDVNIIDVPVVDMQSLQGPNDRFDWNGAIGLNYSSTPLWTLTAMYSQGGLSGSNGTEFYLGSIQSVETGVRFHMANLNPRAQGRKWNTVPYLLYTYNGYASTLYFQADLSEQNQTSGWASGYALGLEASYHMNANWTLYLSPSFRYVGTDALDGWDYGAGSDHFVRTNVGIKYRFAKKKKNEELDAFSQNLSDMNLWSAENIRQAEGIQNGIAERIQNKVMEETKKASDSAFAALDESLETVQTVKADMEKFAEETRAELERVRQEQQLSVMSSALTTVFFGVNSSSLTEQARKSLYTYAAELKSMEDMASNVTVTITSHTDITGSDRTNERLREARSAAVKNYLQEVLGVTYDIEVINDAKDYHTDKLVDRRVDVHVTLK
jgi:outer membrane protein OmpA-like peptidoglycan-associated protein